MNNKPKREKEVEKGLNDKRVKLKGAVTLEDFFKPQKFNLKKSIKHMKKHMRQRKITPPVI